MSSKHKISVVIPLFNKRNYIRRAIQSVLSQTHSNLELIVVNDGSTDGSGDVAMSIDDPRLRIHTQANAGEGAARNRGAELAKCSWVAYLDADDCWEPDFLVTVVDMIERFPEAVLCATGYRIQSPGSSKLVGARDDTVAVLHSNYFALAYQEKLPFCASSVAIRRSVLMSCGGFAEAESLGADQDLWCRLLTNHPFALNTRALAIYHEDAQGRICNSQLPTAELAFSTRLQAKIDSGQIPADQLPDAKRYIAAHLLHLATLHARQGSWESAIRFLSQSRTRSLRTKRSLKFMQFHALRLWKKNLATADFNGRSITS